MYYIKETANILKTSIRTLHYYDEIGLLQPQKDSNGYRTYSESDIEYLRIALIYSHLGFPLEKISKLLEQAETNPLSLLQNQLKALQQEKERLDLLLNTLQKIIQAHQGTTKINVKNQFKGFKTKTELNSIL